MPICSRPVSKPLMNPGQGPVSSLSRVAFRCCGQRPRMVRGMQPIIGTTFIAFERLISTILKLAPVRTGGAPLGCTSGARRPVAFAQLVYVRDRQSAGA